MRSICGLIGAVPSESLRPMARAMDPAGEKTFSHYESREAALLCADRELPMQPRELRLRDRHWVLAFRGRLRNADELRWELLQENHALVETTDEELVLHAYAQWGSECVLHLRGGYAFGVWDAAQKRLFLARDPMGEETVFYGLRDGVFRFASERRTILADPGFPAEIDETGIAELLLIGPGRTPGCGVLRGIAELEPGCTAVFEQGRVKKDRFWKLRDGPHNLDFPETARLIRDAVTRAVQSQLSTECGCFLSGGLDSGIVCAVAAQGRECPLPTFSVDYAGNDRYFVPGKFQPTSDSDYLGILEAHLGTEPHHVILTPEELEAGMEEAVIARDAPGMGDVDVSLLQFARQIRQTVPSALSGECADELFGGYPWYRDPELRDYAGFPWARSTENRLALLQPGLCSETCAGEYLRSRYEKTLAECDILPGTEPDERRRKQMMNLNLRWFMQTLLERNRAMSAAADLEIRCPFCDEELATLLYRIPWEMKEHGGEEKGLLRAAFAGSLPDAILHRKKSPYPKTHDPQFLRRMQERMAALLEDRSAPIWQLVRPEAVRTLAAQESDWPFYGQLMRTPQTLCYLLQLDFWLRHYRVTVRR